MSRGLGSEPASRSGLAAGRLVSIDALRGIAAVAVVCFHALRFRRYVGAPNLIGKALALLFSWGFSGVYLFFVISGFCIHLRWATQQAAGDDPAIDFLGFWKRRFRRLYPAYLVSFVLYFLIQWKLGTFDSKAPLWLDVPIHLLLLHNLLPSTTYTLNGVFWTLAVEEQLYALYFLLLRLRVRLGWARLLALTIVVRAAWFALGFLVHRRFHVEFTVHESAAAAWFAWALGALAVEARLGLQKLPSWCSSGLAGLGFLVVAAGCNQLQLHGARTGMAHHLLWFAEQPLWALGYFAIVNWMSLRETRFLSNTAVLLWSKIGLFSYSVYLIHEIFLTEALTWISRRLHFSPDQTTVLAFCVLVPVSIAAARLFFELFERPFMNRSVATAKPTAIASAG